MNTPRMPEKVTTSHLKESVLGKITREGVCPRSRWFFRCREGVLWMVWLLTVVVGALALAVTLYVLSFRNYALYEATHDNFLTFIVDVLPYLWLVAFVVMVGMAVFDVRQTARGHRHSLWKVIGSSIALSMVGGIGLHAFHVGFVVDRLMGDYMPSYYDSQMNLEYEMWQAPNDGRLVGHLLSDMQTIPEPLVFSDIAGVTWSLNTSDLHEKDALLLRTGKQVRLIGMTVSTATNASTPRLVFHACGVFPWHFEKPMSMKELAKERFEVIEKMRTPKPAPTLAPEQATATAPTLASISAVDCAEILMMRRLKKVAP